MKAHLSQAAPTCLQATANGAGHACRAARNPCKSGRTRRTSRKAWPGHQQERQGSVVNAPVPESTGFTQNVQLHCPAPLAPIASAVSSQGPLGTENEKLPSAASQGLPVVLAIRRGEEVGSSVLSGVGLVIERLVERSDDDARAALIRARYDDTTDTAPVGGNITCFHTKSPPKISISSFLARIYSHIPLSDATFIMSLVYIDRLAERDSQMVVTSLSWAKLLITGVMLASKYLDDEEDIHYNNAFYAKVGGLSVKELDMLEMLFLRSLDWRLFVTEAEYTRYHELVHDSKLCGLQ